MGQIQYSEKYFDDTCEYRHVVLPPEVAKLLPKNRLLSENEWLPPEYNENCNAGIGDALDCLKTGQVVRHDPSSDTIA
ncbi:Cyclin-dependent kinases regulatory subunit (Cell division control protein cks1) [Orobanche minor]